MSNFFKIEDFQIDTQQSDKHNLAKLVQLRKEKSRQIFKLFQQELDL